METSQKKTSVVALAKDQITQLEAALQSAISLARSVHIMAMRASEELGHKHNTGATHACLALVECSVRALNQANDAARYSRHSLEYPEFLPSAIKPTVTANAELEKLILHCAYEHVTVTEAVNRAFALGQKSAPPSSAASPAEDLESEIRTLAEFQDAIRDELIKLSGNDRIDGAGCESGDPLDFTLTEIRQAFAYIEDHGVAPHPHTGSDAKD